MTVNKINITNNNVHFARVVDIVNSVAHTAPVAKLKYEDGEETLMIAPEGLTVNDVVAVGDGAELKIGNTIPLGNIPEGTMIYNIEATSGDGGKYVRSSGVFAKVMARTGNKVNILLPSKKLKSLSSKCKATIGVVAGGGRPEKPFVKAGHRWHAMRAKGKLYPITSAVAMNANEHPFGCGRGRHMGKPSNPPRFAPPGRNVGQMHAKRMGRKR